MPIVRAAVWMRLLFTPISPAFPYLLNRLIKREKPDILHIHTPNISAFWALFLPGARRIPWVIQWQSDVLASEHHWGLQLFYKIYRPFERAMLKRAKVIIASSPTYLASSLPLQEFSEKCVVIPLGLDPSTLAATSSVDTTTTPNQQHSSCLRVLAIGRLTYYKGFDYLIQAVARMDDIQLDLVGQGDEDTHLKALTKKLGADDKVCFHGHLSSDDLARQFTRCDCVCLPSIERTEAFGLVLLEAMYFGKATIASDVPGSGMGWIVDQGVTGLKTTPGNVDELLGALQLLQQNRDRIDTLGKNGSKKFDQYFHINRSSEQIARLYQRVLYDNRALPE